VHFLAAGGVLFLATRAWLSPGASPAEAVGSIRAGAPPREEIVVSREQVRALEEDFAQRWGRPPEHAERTALVAELVRDEMLYREARRLALDAGDASVRRRLLEKMRALRERPSTTDASAGGEEISPEEALVREAKRLGLDE